MINTALDRLVRPEIHFLSRSWSSFQVCGSTGLAFAFLLSMGLVLARGLSPWTMVAITLAASATFLALAMLTKVLTGEERLTYYYHMIVVLITTGLLLMLLRPEGLLGKAEWGFLKAKIIVVRKKAAKEPDSVPVA